MFNVRQGHRLNGKWLFTWLSLVMSLMVSHFVCCLFSDDMSWMTSGTQLFSESSPTFSYRKLKLGYDGWRQILSVLEVPRSLWLRWGYNNNLNIVYVFSFITSEFWRRLFTQACFAAFVILCFTTVKSTEGNWLRGKELAVIVPMWPGCVT